MPPRLLLAVKVLAVVAVAAFPLLFLGHTAGDAVIHLVFAENALHGQWFCFNPGEPSGGETSPGYLLLVMGLLHVLGPAATPAAMSLLGYAAWLTLLGAGLLLVRALAGAWSWFWLVVVGLMPGSALNSVLGMENVLLGGGLLVLLLWLHRADGLRRTLGWPRELALAVGLAALAWIRPEAYPVALVLLAYRAAHLRAWAVLATTAALVTVLFLASLGVVAAATGDLPLTAGVARLDLSSAGGLLLGGILPVHGKMALRLLAYAPLTAAFLLGLRSPRDPLVTLCALLGVTFAVAFSTVLPSVHLARYSIFYWPLLAVVAVSGMARWTGDRPRTVVFGAATALLALQLGVYTYELSLRRRMGAGHTWSQIARAPAERTEATDDLLAWLDHRGPLPVSVALKEVQLRYVLDERVDVRSLDGIVDRTLHELARRGPGGVDLDVLGYLRARHVDYLLEYPELPASWSPHLLERLSPGTVIEEQGVRFERLGDATRVTYAE